MEGQNCEGDVCLIDDAPDLNDSSEEKDPIGANEPPSENKKSTRQKKEKPTVQSSIVTLHGQQDFDAFISKNSNVIVEFMTTWCCKCQGIEDYYEELSSTSQQQQNESVKAAKVVCDKNKQTKKLTALHNVKSYPVFLVFKDGSVANRWDGADVGKLEGAFERLAGGGKGGGGKKKQRGKNRR